MSVERTALGLHAHFRIHGDLQRLRIAPPSAARRVDGLWRHTCCELFVARDGEAAYLEFNFAPSGAWAAYAFERYREAAALPAVLPGCVVHRDKACLHLHAEVPLAKTGPLRVAASAVLEDVEGGLSHWALAHPPGPPDFHHRDGFVLELA